MQDDPDLAVILSILPILLDAFDMALHGNGEEQGEQDGQDMQDDPDLAVILSILPILLNGL